VILPAYVGIVGPFAIVCRPPVATEDGRQLAVEFDEAGPERMSGIVPGPGVDASSRAACPTPGVDPPTAGGYDTPGFPPAT
jgi:hypothetical protein